MRGHLAMMIPVRVGVVLAGFAVIQCGVVGGMQMRVGVQVQYCTVRGSQG